MSNSLKSVQKLMAEAVMRPLDEQMQMQSTSAGGGDMHEESAAFISPGKHLSSFERLQIYNQQYWFRLIDCMYEDFPGLRAVLGDRKFDKLIEAYLTCYPSTSYTLSHIGCKLPQFLKEEPQWGKPQTKLSQQMAEFEVAQILAFDAPALKPISTDDVLHSPAGELRLGVQPFVHLLTLDFALDEFDVARKKMLRQLSEAGVARGGGRKTSSHGVKNERVYLAVHRFDNDIYYKRLRPETFAILSALKAGLSLEMALSTAIDCSQPCDVEQMREAVCQWFAELAQLGWFCRTNEEQDT
jgi:hypothetical protein